MERRYPQAEMICELDRYDSVNDGYDIYIQGVSLGWLVMIMLTAHLMIISGLDSDNVSNRPQGALMTAIQAVRCLHYPSPHWLI